MRDWLLAERGHGQEWAHIFHVGPLDAKRIWLAIAGAVLDATIYKVIDRGRDGIVCGVELELTIGSRTARVMTSWHYENVGSTPRLVTAYPRF
jgi:hypothetical protein